MYILILTLLLNPYDHTPAMTSVPGFTSYESCNAAATAWKQSVLKAQDGHGYPTMSATCAKA